VHQLNDSINKNGALTSTSAPGFCFETFLVLWFFCSFCRQRINSKIMPLLDSRILSLLLFLTSIIAIPLAYITHVQYVYAPNGPKELKRSNWNAIDNMFIETCYYSDLIEHGQNQNLRNLLMSFDWSAFHLLHSPSLVLARNSLNLEEMIKDSWWQWKIKFICSWYINDQKESYWYRSPSIFIFLFASMISILHIILENTKHKLRQKLHASRQEKKTN
jgi:hypothetical protein